MEEKSALIYKCIIVDDDPGFVYLLSHYLSLVPKLHLSGSFLNPKIAMESIREEDEIDFLFLDVRMGNISGLDVAKHLRDKVKFIVFISATGEFAFEALQVGGDHYLVKPIMFQKFLETVNNVLERYKWPITFP